MPLYEFENLKTKKIKDFFFAFAICPPLGEILTIEGEKWKRIITRPPCGIVKGSDNPMTPQEFVEDSGKKRGTLGNLYDKSRELSEERKKHSPDGRDKIQDKWFDDYSKKRSGKSHPSDDRPAKSKKVKSK